MGLRDVFGQPSPASKSKIVKIEMERAVPFQANTLVHFSRDHVQLRRSLLAWLHTRGNARGSTVHCSGGSSCSWTLSATETDPKFLTWREGEKGLVLKNVGNTATVTQAEGKCLFTKMAQPCGQRKPREGDISTLEIKFDHLGQRACTGRTQAVKNGELRSRSRAKITR